MCFASPSTCPARAFHTVNAWMRLTWEYQNSTRPSRLAAWRAAGLDIFEGHEEQSWPRISARFDFKAPLRFQDEFEVRTEMGAVTRSTIQWAHVLMRRDTVIGNGTVTAVCVKKNPDGTMKSAPIPEEIISRLRSAFRS